MTDFCFTRSASIALLTIGVIAGMIPALQGTLLPQLVNEGRLTLAELGQVAMAEAAASLLAVTVANVWFKYERLRYVVVGAALIGLSTDLATPYLTGHAILLLRFIHGLCAGIIMWVWVGFLTRSDNPGRWVAIYITVQAVTVLVLSSWFSAVLLPQGGALAGFGVLAGLYGLIGLLVVLFPRRFPALYEGGGSVMPNAKGWLGLFVVFAQLSAILAMWVYIKPYGIQIGLGETTTATAVSVALGAQIVAGLLATVMVGRVRAALVILLVAAGSVAALAALIVGQTAISFIAATTVFAFLWMLVPAFHMPYLIDIDPSRRSAAHVPTAQLLGLAAGPALASMALNDGNVTGSLFAAAALYGISGIVVVLIALKNSPSGQGACTT